jgi:hypothetical protein
MGFLDYHGDFDLRDTRLEGLPLLHVMSKPKEEGGTDDDTDDNDTEIDDNDDGDVAAREKAFGFQDRLFTANVTGNPSLAFCTFVDCDLGRMCLLYAASSLLVEGWEGVRDESMLYQQKREQ